jgi:hypothetical protein
VGLQGEVMEEGGVEWGQGGQVGIERQRGGGDENDRERMRPLHCTTPYSHI